MMYRISRKKVNPMVIREYGGEHPRHLLYFQGSCEPWTEFRESAELLAERFHVMLVTPDGHDPAERNDFISVEKTVDDAVAWLRTRGIDHLDAVCPTAISAITSTAT